MTVIAGARIESSLLTSRGINQIQAVANRLGALQFRDNLKYRFEGRKRGLKFRRRSNTWNQRKRRVTGNITPLVFTGAMRKSVLTKARVTATSKQGRMISTTGVRGFRSAQWRSQVRQELEQVTPAEERAVGKLQGKTFATLAANPRYQRKQRKRA